MLRGLWPLAVAGATVRIPLIRRFHFPHFTVLATNANTVALVYASRSLHLSKNNFIYEIMPHYYIVIALNVLARLNKLYIRFGRLHEVINPLHGLTTYNYSTFNFFLFVNVFIMNKIIYPIRRGIVSNTQAVKFSIVIIAKLMIVTIINSIISIR
jgi:hypothetical protein